MSVEGVSPKGKTYKASFTHVRRKNALYMYVVVLCEQTEALRWERLVELKRELHTRAAKGERHNVYVAGEAKEHFVHSANCSGIPEAFARAVWQRTSDERVKAIYECFEDKSDKPTKEEPEQDLFS